MKKAIKVTEEGVSVNKRFFQAIDMLIARNIIHSFREFTLMYEINYGNFYITRQFPEKNNIKVEQLVYITRDFGINPKWLLLGEGDVFCNKNCK